MEIRPPTRARLALGGLGTVSCASALAFAGVLAGVLLVAAALTFAIVLALAGVLGKVLRSNEQACNGAELAVASE